MTTTPEVSTNLVDEKPCTVCKKVRPLENYPKSGKGTFRPECKPCYNFKRRNTYDITKRIVRTADTWRKAPEYYDFPMEQRKENYHNVIDRMARFGIMSAEYAEKARQTVDAL